jgi:hypothetical protein
MILGRKRVLRIYCEEGLQVARHSAVCRPTRKSCAWARVPARRSMVASQTQARLETQARPCHADGTYRT